MSESSFEQQISAIILLLHVLFLWLFSNPAICLHKNDLNIFSLSSRQIHSVKGKKKKHSWAAQLKQHCLPVTRSVREVGISEAGLLAHVHSQKNQKQILTFAARIFTDVLGEPSYGNAQNSFASSAYIFHFLWKI